MDATIERWWAPMLVAFVLLSSWHSTRTFSGVDFHAQAGVSQLVGKAGFENVYAGPGADAARAELLRQGTEEGASPQLKDAALFNSNLQSTVTPFCFTVFRALRAADYDHAIGRYRLLLLLGLALGTYAFARAAGSTSLGAWIGAALVGGSWFEPADSLLRAANVSSLQLAALALVLVLGRGGVFRQGLASVVLGLVVMFKPNVAAVLPLLFVARLSERNWPRLRLELGGAIGGAVMAVLASWYVIGSIQPWVNWAEFMPSFLENPPGPAHGNISLAQLLGGSWTWGLSVVAMALALAAVYRSPGPENDARTIALGLGITLISAPLVWLHYYVLAIPLFLVTMIPTPGAPVRTAFRCAIGSAAFTVLSFQLIVTLVPVGDEHALVWMYAGATASLFVWTVLDSFWLPARRLASGTR